MSFILDALKKIEEDRRRAQEGRPRESLAVGRARSTTLRQWLAMSAIAVASALATASALYFFRGSESSVASESSASSVSVSEEPANAGEGPPPAVLRSEEGELATAGAEPQSLSEPGPPGAAWPTRFVGADPGADSDSRLEAEAEGRAELPPADTFQAMVDDSPESPPPIRLVGQGSERALVDSPGLATGADPGGASPPDGAPKLVLQGTSVIDGQPVAVVNDQRVFEGDRVEGARVIRIEERAVELEFEGRRFRIRL